MSSTARAALAGAILMVTLLVGPASASPPAATTVYVDCAAAPGGDGRKQSPFSTITASLPSARALAAQSRVTISVGTVVCDTKTFPVELNFPVDLRGSRAPDMDGVGFPLGTQDRDTRVTWTPPSPVPPSVANLAFLPMRKVLNPARRPHARSCRSWKCACFTGASTCQPPKRGHEH